MWLISALAFGTTEKYLECEVERKNWVEGLTQDEKLRVDLTKWTWWAAIFRKDRNIELDIKTSKISESGLVFTSLASEGFISFHNEKPTERISSVSINLQTGEIDYWVNESTISYQGFCREVKKAIEI